MPLENVRSAGESAEFRHNSAFGRLGGSVVELIEAISLAPERVAQGFAAPRPRIHHVAHVLAEDEVDGVRETLDGTGFTEYLRSEFGGVETTVPDARATLGHDLEIHVDNDGLRGFFEMVGSAAEGWDGAEPLRRLDL